MINVYIQRGSVVLSGKHIDDTHPQNSEWLKSQQERNYEQLKKSTVENKILSNVATLKPPRKGSVVKEEQVHEKKTPTLPPVHFTEPEEPVQSKGTITKTELDVKLKRADLEKRIEEIEILRVKKMKLHGELIPTELVKSLILELSEAIKLSYMDAIENYTVVVSKVKRLTEHEKSEIKNNFTEIINKALKRQIEIAKKGLKNIVEEYQEVKGKGERE